MRSTMDSPAAAPFPLVPHPRFNRKDRVRALVTVLFQLALGLWAGGVVFVSFVVAPAVFRVVPSETAGVVMGQIFPLYYGFSVALGVVALGSSLWLWRRTGGTGAWTAIVVMLVVMLAATTYAGAVVNPQARALRAALHQAPIDPNIRAEFDTLHQRAVQLNGLVLLLSLTTITVAALSVRFPGET
jgi:hypothetical protein